LLNIQGDEKEMKQLINGRVVFVVLAVACLTGVLLAVTPTNSSSPSGGVYDPLAGLNTNSAVVQFDSGWVNINDKCGQYFTVPHGLNSMDVIVDIYGKTTLGGGVHQVNLGGTGYTPGWSETYGGADYDYAHCIIHTVDGGYALAGSTGSLFPEGGDAWLVKTDANGIMQWQRTYGGAGYDGASSVVQTVGGGYVLAGYTASYGSGGYDFWLIKTDPNGFMVWNRTYGGIASDWAYSVVQTGDGGFALAGYTLSFGAGSTDAWLVKTDANGIMQWGYTYGGAGNDEALSLIRSIDGGYVLGGDTSSYGSGDADFWLVKTDANGNAQWNKTYGGVANDLANWVIQTVDGGYALAGHTASLGVGSFDAWLVKTDGNGNMQWGYMYGGTDDDYVFSVVQTVEGGYALAGETSSLGPGAANAWLVKTDANGIMQWQRTYTRTGSATESSYAHSVVQNADGSFTLAGMTYLVGGSNDALFVRTESESGLVWADSTPNAITLYRGATDPYWNFVRVTVTVRSSTSFLVVRGWYNDIWYRLFNETTGTWNAWEKLPGATLDSPAAVIVGNQLRIVVRGMDGMTMWYGYVDILTDTFSGWTALDGATPSAPALASSDTTQP
jgi:hypothetical protein